METQDERTAMVEVETQQQVESLTQENLMKFYRKPSYEAQYHFQVYENTLRRKVSKFGMKFKEFFSPDPLKNLTAQEILVYSGRPIWRVVYDLQVKESTLRARCKALQLGLWDSASSVSHSVKTVKRKANLDFAVRLLGKKYPARFDVPYAGLSLNKLKELVGITFDLQGANFSLEYHDGKGNWLILRTDEHLATCLHHLGYHLCIQLKAEQL